MRISFETSLAHGELTNTGLPWICAYPRDTCTSLIHTETAETGPVRDDAMLK